MRVPPATRSEVRSRDVEIRSSQGRSRLAQGTERRVHGAGRFAHHVARTKLRDSDTTDCHWGLCARCGIHVLRCRGIRARVLLYQINGGPMREWLMILCLVLFVIACASALLPSLLLSLDERREKRMQAQRRLIILPGE